MNPPLHYKDVTTGGLISVEPIVVYKVIARHAGAGSNILLHHGRDADSTNPFVQVDINDDKPSDIDFGDGMVFGNGCFVAVTGAPLSVWVGYRPLSDVVSLSTN